MSIICAICNKKQSGWIQDFPLSPKHGGVRICSECHGELERMTNQTNLEAIAYWERYIETIEDEEIRAYIEMAIKEAKEEFEGRTEAEKERALQKQAEVEEAIQQAQQDYFDYSIHGENPLYEIKGNRGRRITVYPHKCVIKTDVTLGSVVTKNSMDGEKTIYYKDIIGIQFKKPGLAIGYLQLETASSQGNNNTSNFFNENTFTFDNYDEVYEVYKYIISRLDEIKN